VVRVTGVDELFWMWLWAGMRFIWNTARNESHESQKEIGERAGLEDDWQVNGYETFQQALRGHRVCI